MKALTALIIIAVLSFGCINSSTNFSNRGVTYQVTPENIGEHSAVSGSPTSNDSTVNAEKKYETAAKTNVAQNLTDTSTNDQHMSSDPQESKAQVEKSEK